MNMKPDRPTLGILIRFSNSAETLPEVLSALARQTVLPDKILGIANQSRDASHRILREAGADIAEWSEPYHHSKVLNFGMSRLETDLVLVLSSHTVLESEDALAKLIACFEDPDVSCASAKWDRDSYYSDCIDWAELQRKGLRFGSIYSNSMGMVRRSAWHRTNFDESIDTSEDYAWAIERLRRGDRCARIDFRFSHLRGGATRDREFADIVFQLAYRYCLPVAWLGPIGSIKFLSLAWLKRSRRNEWKPVKERFFSWLSAAIFMEWRQVFDLRERIG